MTPSLAVRARWVLGRQLRAGAVQARPVLARAVLVRAVRAARARWSAQCLAQ
ncbi:MAG TPA: hypothetical protein VGQ26_28725 [Streptosporangiaceae bacterium]|nr:hypothetical protein [Streptosporangiaceae bacterium]